MFKIHLEKSLVAVDTGDGERTIQVGSQEAFDLISSAWIRSGWDGKYVYSFSWMGRPIIQLPDDVMRIQEAIYAVKPDVVVETGVAHGGSLILYASLFRAMGCGRVIGVDIETVSYTHLDVYKRQPHHYAVAKLHLAGLYLKYKE